jgi:hypothetical protein
MVGDAHPWGLDIFSIQDERVPIAVGIIIGGRGRYRNRSRSRFRPRHRWDGGRCPPYDWASQARRVGTAHHPPLDYGYFFQFRAGKLPLRLIVIAPIPYRLSFHSRAFYRRPAYFLCDNLDLPLKTLIQASIDHWQIEVNHRDEKQHIGLQHPQVWNERSVDRLPAFMVASYSFLLLASLQAYGARRSDQYLRPAQWQRNRPRPSCLDLISLLVGGAHPTWLRQSSHLCLCKRVYLQEKISSLPGRG